MGLMFLLVRSCGFSYVFACLRLLSDVCIERYISEQICTKSMEPYCCPFHRWGLRTYPPIETSNEDPTPYVYSVLSSIVERIWTYNTHPWASTVAWFLIGWSVRSFNDQNQASANAFSLSHAHFQPLLIGQHRREALHPCTIGFSPASTILRDKINVFLSLFQNFVWKS
jgi:hypothetical protein